MTAPTTVPVICAGPRYPCTLVRPNGDRVQVKALLTSGKNAGVPELYAWSGEVHTDGPVLLVQVPWWPAESSIRRDGSGVWTVATDYGLYRVEPGTGGCSRCSSLGRWDPWNPMRYGAQPRDTGRP